MNRVLTATFLCLLTACPALAGSIGDGGSGISPAELFPWADFDSSIPTLQQVVGVEHGSRPLRHAELMAYLDRLAAASPRAKIETYSHTYEGRKLVTFIVSEAATVQRLDAFQKEHAKRLDPRGRAAAEDSALFLDAKAVAWMAYGIHGDELSSVDAAAALAYWLVAGNDERARTLRRELVILIDPMENPDGRDRYLAQTRSFAHKVPSHDLEDLSHTSVWPWGRGNHYLFDLNRDWFSMVHPESRRSSVIADWNPQLMVDAHEMGANDTYLFSPPRHPFNPLLPGSHREWWNRFGEDQARALDGRGYAYYTREWNEEFFPGYGSSWAAYHGALGILYEMSRTTGTHVKKRDGSTRTFPQAVEHQAVSSVANLETLATNRAAMLKDFVADRRTAIADAGNSVGTWVLPRGRHPERTDALVELLRSQNVEVGYTDETLEGLREIQTGIESRVVGDAWVVPLNQPAAPLVRVLLDPHVPMEAEFLREEREYRERGKGGRLYEITAWSLPLCYGVEALWTRRVLEGEVDRAVEPAPGRFEASQEAVSYLLSGRSDHTAPALTDLFRRGVAVKVADKPFEVAGRSFDRGSLLIEREGNPEDLEDQLREVARLAKVDLVPTPTAKAASGPDLGGSHFDPLVAPRVGVWAGFPISPTSYGALWHLFDEKMGLRFSALDMGLASGVDLDRYNVLIFPPSFRGAASYRSMLGESGVAELKRWIAAGGTAIGVGNGAEFLADKELALTRTRLRRQALDRYPPVVLSTTPEEAQAGGPFRATGLRAPREEPEADTAGVKKKKPAKEPIVKRSSPYDVAPVLGAGARPFAAGVDLGTPVAPEPVDLSKWLVPYMSPGKVKADEEDLQRADGRLRSFSPQGAFLRIELDPEVWLNWGLPESLPAMIRARDTLVAEPPVQVAARFADLEQLHLGGLLWPEAAGRLAQTAYATRESVGRGQVILFLNEPEFRGWTLGTRRLLMNAILFGPGLGTRWSSPW